MKENVKFEAEVEVEMRDLVGKKRKWSRIDKEEQGEVGKRVYILISSYPRCRLGLGVVISDATP